MLNKILKDRNYSTIFITIFVFGLIYIFSFLWVFYNLDKKVQDNYSVLKNQLFWSNVSKDLIIVEIDEETLWELWIFPFDRKIYSKLIKNLDSVWVSIIAFDLIFEDKTNIWSDEDFWKSIKDAKNVVFWISFDDDSIKEPLDILWKNVLTKWYLRPNVDKTTWLIYSITPLSIFSWKIYEHFSISILKAYYSYIYNENFLNNFLVFDNNYYITPEIKVPLSRKYWLEILINYINREKFNNVSFIDVYDDSKFEKLKKEIDFKDKIIIIWTTAKGIKDVFNTPTWIEYWVYVHANIINTILTKSFLVYFDKNIEWILLLLVFIVSIYFNLSRSWYVLLTSNLLLIIVFCVISPILILTFTNLVINFPIELIFWLLFSLAFANIVKFIIENENRLKLNRALSEYVSWNIAEEIMSWTWKYNLNWENKEIAIFFSDIVWFTSISEKLTPEALVWFLRQYLTQMWDIIIGEKWFVNKYVWDSIIALWWVFGRDDKASCNACMTALKQQKFLYSVNKVRKEKWLFEINIRIWITFWSAIIWNIWSPGKKLEFTALWDNVNLASRLEWVNKYYWTNICVSEEVYNQTKNYFEFRYLDKIKVKWKNIWVKIYELVEEKWKLTLKQSDIISKFEHAVSLYLSRNFTDALEIFNSLEENWDCPSTTYKKRCQMFIKKAPSKDWDGIWVMEEK